MKIDARVGRPLLINSKFPTIIISSDDMSGGVPKPAIGSPGDYAIDGTTTNNKAFVKTTASGWVEIGVNAWFGIWSAVQGTVTNPTVTIGHAITINGNAISMTSTTAAQVVADINAAAVTGVTASLTTAGNVRLFGDETTVNGKIIISGSGTVLADIGITAGTYNVPAVEIAPHTSIPEWRSGDTTPRPTGSLYIKTSSANTGADLDVSAYSSITDTFADKNLERCNFLRKEIQAWLADKDLCPTGPPGLALASPDMSKCRLFIKLRTLRVQKILFEVISL